MGYFHRTLQFRVKLYADEIRMVVELDNFYQPGLRVDTGDLEAGFL